jgi:hypothetical protein
VQSAGLAGPGGRYISIAEAVIAAFAQESKNRGRIDTANEAPKTQSERRLADVRAVIEHA